MQFTDQGSTDVESLASSLKESYEILSVLGSGGSGTVFKARHLGMDRLCALKVLNTELTNDPRAVKRFQQEALTLSQLSHPNIAKVYNFGTTRDQQLYIDMEYVPGPSLRDLLRQGAIELSSAIGWFTEICAALAHAHSFGIIHRDIKPGNVILTRETPCVRVLDFGIAKRTDIDDSEMSLTQTGAIIGSPAYMSPEQCLSAKLDQRSDVYSLGCLMYEVLCGKPPFEGDSTLTVMSAHMHSVPPPPTISSRKLHPDLMHIVMKCLEKDPAQRWQDMTSLRKALEDLEQSVDLDSPPPVESMLRKQYMMLPLILIILLLVAGAFAMHKFVQMKNEEAAKASVAQIERAQISSEKQKSAEELLRNGISLLKQGKLAKAQEEFRSAKVEAQDSNPAIYLAALCLRADYPSLNAFPYNTSHKCSNYEKEANAAVENHLKTSPQDVVDAAHLVKPVNPLAAALLLQSVANKYLKKDDHSDTAQYQAALRLYREAFDCYPATKHFKKSLVDFCNYVRVAFRLNQLEEANRVANFVESNVTRMGDTDKFAAKRAHVLMKLGEACEDAAPERAAQLFEQANKEIAKAKLEDIENSGEPDHVATFVSIQSDRIEWLRKHNRHDQADKLLARTKAILDAYPEEEIKQAPEAAGDFYSNAEQFEEAIRQYDRAIGVLEKFNKIEHTLKSIARKASCLHQLGRDMEAYQAVTYAISKLQAPDDDINMKFVPGRLELYQVYATVAKALNKTDEAAEALRIQDVLETRLNSEETGTDRSLKKKKKRKGRKKMKLSPSEAI